LYKGLIKINHFIRRAVVKNEKNEKGFMLIETLVSMALLSTVGVAVLSALSASSIALRVNDEQFTARKLAEIQMQGVRKSDFALTYSPSSIPSDYSGYTVSIDAFPVTLRDENIQKIVVTVNHESRQVFSMEDMKVNR
jgi:type II secretory pathway pseudopilin PulG